LKKKRGTYKDLVGKAQGMDHLELMCRCEDSMKIDHNEISWGDIILSQTGTNGGVLSTWQ
jgi:hypothetical protein